MNVIETKRLILRHLTMDDLSPLATIYSDPEVRRYFPEGTLAYEETKEELEWVIEVYYGRYGFGLWATIDKGTGEFIGRCGLVPWTIVPVKTGGSSLRHADESPGANGTEVELAYLLDRNHWGLGLGTEAAQAIVDYGFERLHLRRLICLFDPKNRASANVAAKVGMTYETDVELDGELIPLFSISAEGAEVLRKSR